MDILFFMFLLVSVVLLLAGIINPSLLFPLLRTKMSRKKIVLIFGAATILFFVLTGVSGNNKEVPHDSASIPQKNDTAIGTQASAPGIVTKAPSLDKVIFDIPSLAAKSYTQIKVTLGKPTEEELPNFLNDFMGSAAWRREDITLSIKYNRYGILWNDPHNSILPCAINIFSLFEDLSEGQLRKAGNLPQTEKSFVIEAPGTGLILTFSIQPDIKPGASFIGICPAY